MNTRFVLLAAGMLTLCTGANLTAGEPLDPADVSLMPTEPMPVASDWEYEAILYGWFAGMKGDTGFNGNIETIDIDFSDIASNLDFAIAGAFGGSNGTWGFFVDGMYIKISTDQPISGPLFNKADISVWSGLGNFYGTYRVFDQPAFRMDLIGGARVTYSKTKIRLQENLAPSAIGGSDSNTWVDAVIGVRGRWSLTERIFLAYCSTVGGGSSDLTWSVLGGIGYRFNDRADIRLAYNILDTDYEKGDQDFVYDLRVQGLMLGLGISW